MKNQSLRSIVHFLLKIMHYSINLVFPKDKLKLIFMSGPDDYVDNSRALSDYILSNNDLNQFKVYWVFRSDDVKHVNSKVHPIYLNHKYGKFKYFFHTVTSRYLFSTHGAFEWACPYRQTFLCLWHGTMLKRIAYMQNPIRNKYYLRNCSFFVSPSSFYNSIVASSFNRKESNIVTTGYPRVDLLFQNTDALQKLNIERRKYKKIVIYMPTFRQVKDSVFKETKLDVYNNEIINFSDDNSLVMWNNYFRTLGILLILKPHPSDNNTPKHFNLSNIRVIDNNVLSDCNVQLYHLLHYSDALLTDFSSVFCDYLVLDRPIGFVIPDIDNYSRTRGFVFDNPLDYMPGEIIMSSNDFKKFFSDIVNDIDKSKEIRRLLMSKYNDFSDGQNCYRVLNVLNIV